MNIFILDKDPETCARQHCNKHVVKMILESAQILSTVVRKHWDINDDRLYRPTHFNHPCTLWAKSPENFFWLYKLGKELAKEYTHRYGKTHKSERVLDRCVEYIDIKSLESTSPLSFVLAMPDEYKNEDPVKAYRTYYINDKKNILQYKNRETPSWIEFY